MTRDYTQYWSTLKASHTSHPANRFRYQLLAGELAAQDLKPQRVVDCGCGDGSLLAVVGRRLSCEELHGLDVAENVPTEQSAVPIHFRRQDLGLPVANELRGQFDLVLCSEVIEHVADDEMVLRNLYHLAKGGGWVALTTQSGRIYRTEQFLGHLRHYDFGELCCRVAANGLSIQRAFRCGWPWLTLQKIAAHYFFRTVERRIIRVERLSLPVRILFGFLCWLYRLSSRRHGPQIIIVAQKPWS